MSLNNALSQLNPSSWSQSERLLRLTTPYGADQLLVESFKGIEDLNQGFKLAITVLSIDAHISLKSLIGQAVLLELLTAHSRTELRPFHGHVTRMEALGANGGFARYRLQVEPWTAFMAHRIDSTTYQDMTVVELLESIFKDYQHQARGRLSPAWRFELADASAYAKRSLTSQYQESDLAFVQRLMNEEGLYSWIEHTGDAGSPSLGSHTLVIADHNDAFTPNRQPDIDYARVSAVMKHDRLDRWRQHVSWVSNAVSHSSWDYRQMNSRPVAAQVASDQVTIDQVTTDTTADHHAEGNQPKPRPTLSLQETPGAYAYQTTDQGQRLADRQLEALIAYSNRYTGAGTVRTLSPGTTFTLHGHDTTGALDADGNANTLVITRVVHQAYNNLTADLQSQIAHHLGLQAQHLDHDGIDNNINAAIHNPASHNSAINTTNPYDLEAANQQGERPLYRNRIDAILKRIPYRNRTVDEHSTPLYPKPTITGQQTAIVVGPADQVIYTDRDYRIKVQFHWQRGLNNNHSSHSRLNHPQPEGHTGAPANEQSGTWVRLMTNLAPIAGANWGSHSVPRIGQEVLVDFTDGDIDRPIIIGSLYNGQGQTDAQYNNKGHGCGSTGSATGNAPSWFPGQQGAHAHPAVLSGIKTQGMATSQTGTGSYNQLVFDDTAGQSRTSLQQHSAANDAPETTDQANTSQLNSSELNLGSLRHQTDNQRLNPTGYGTELHSHHSLAVRAGQGLLISTDAKPNASSTQLDSKEAQQQIEQAHKLQSTLANTAQQHNAKLQAEPVEANKLPAILAQAHNLEVISEMTSAGGSTSNNGESRTSTPQANQGLATAYSEPHLQLSSPAGIIASTPKDAILSASNTGSITAGQDINLATQGNQHHLVQKGISLFTYGKVNPDTPDKPNTETGIKLHAASGKVSLQSQSAATHLNADQTVTIASISQSVNIAAPQHLLMTAQGAYLKLSGGNIEIHAPAKVEFKGSLRELAGPKMDGPTLPVLPKPQGIGRVPNKFSVQADCGDWVGMNPDTLAAMESVPYQIKTKEGELLLHGTTNNQGNTSRVYTADAQELVLYVGGGDWEYSIDCLHT